MQGFSQYDQVIESQSVPTFMIRIKEAAEDRTYGSQESGYQEIMSGAGCKGRQTSDVLVAHLEAEVKFKWYISRQNLRCPTPQAIRRWRHTRL